MELKEDLKVKISLFYKSLYYFKVNTRSLLNPDEGTIYPGFVA